LFDQNNNRYLDAVSGIAVCSLGHAHPAVHQAICKQSEKLLHTSNLYGIAVQEQLADKLTEKSGMDNAFFAIPVRKLMKRRSSWRVNTVTSKV